MDAVLYAPLLDPKICKIFATIHKKIQKGENVPNLQSTKSDALDGQNELPASSFLSQSHSCRNQTRSLHIFFSRSTDTQLQPTPELIPATVKAKTVTEPVAAIQLKSEKVKRKAEALLEEVDGLVAARSKTIDSAFEEVSRSVEWKKRKRVRRLAEEMLFDRSEKSGKFLMRPWNND